MNQTNRPHNFLYRCRRCNEIEQSSGIDANDYSRIDMALNIIQDQWPNSIAGIPPKMLGIHYCKDGKAVGISDFIGIKENEN